MKKTSFLMNGRSEEEKEEEKRVAKENWQNEDIKKKRMKKIAKNWR